jgi:hypothetical protein
MVYTAYLKCLLSTPVGASLSHPNQSPREQQRRSWTVHLMISKPHPHQRFDGDFGNHRTDGTGMSLLLIHWSRICHSLQQLEQQRRERWKPVIALAWCAWQKQRSNHFSGGQAIEVTSGPLVVKCVSPVARLAILTWLHMCDRRFFDPVA